LTDYLKKIEYVGPIDGNFIISYKSRQPYFLEFTPRLGWNAFEALMSGMSGVGEFLIKLARGEADKMSLTNSFMVAVDVYAPTDEDIPVRAPLDDWRIFPEGLWHDGKALRSVGCEDSPIGMSPILGIAATGSTIVKATEEIYEEVMPLIHSTDLSYRCDIGKRAERDIELLESWGYVVSREAKNRPSTYTPPTVPAS
jgi:phosphoribosylamine-glycine ligase